MCNSYCVCWAIIYIFQESKQHPINAGKSNRFRIDIFLASYNLSTGSERPFALQMQYSALMATASDRRWEFAQLVEQLLVPARWLTGCLLRFLPFVGYVVMCGRCYRRFFKCSTKARTLAGSSAFSHHPPVLKCDPTINASAAFA